MRRKVAAGVLVGLSALAFAQSPQSVECKQTETQAECHDRLKCKPDEELADCQKRLLRCRANETLEDCEKRTGARQGNQGQQQGNQGQQQQGNQGQQQQGNQGQRGGDRGTQNEGGDRGRQSEGSERGDRGDRGGDRGSERVSRSRDDSSGPRGRRSSPGSHGFVANKKFGLGLELGEPSGLTGKVFVTESGAIDFGVGYVYDNYYYYYNAAGFHAYADYLWHPVSLASAQAFELPFYVGVGGRFWDFNYTYLGMDYSGSAFGIRVPLGIAFDFNNVPLDIFIQVVPVLDFLNGGYYNLSHDRVHFGADVSAGIRFWFK